MATNEEMLVSAFQQKVAIRSSFNLANMFSYAANDLINYWDHKQSLFQNGRLAAILNFVIFT